MKLDSYQKVSISQFKGMYDRGDDHEVPQDHAIDCPNVWLNNPGEVSTRPYGSTLSLALTHKVVAQFMGTTSHGQFLFTMDDAGHIFKGTDTTPFITVPGMVDFVGINIFDKVIFSCILNTWPPEPLWIWDGVNPPRHAAGLAPRPTSAMTVGPGGSGTTDLGWHNYAVSFITQTGFITKPGPWISGVFTPATFNCTTDEVDSIMLMNIPIGPPGTVGRLLLMTKGDEQEYFRVPDQPLLNDNTSTIATIGPSDVELIVSADYLFDLMETIPGSVGDGGLQKYHGRLLSWGGADVEDMINVSYAGDIESVDDVVGYIQLPTEHDGNKVRGCFILRDVLYFTKSVGIFSTQDLNGDDPSNWPISVIDGSVGSFNSGISTITSSQSGLPLDDIILLLSYGGLYVFNGVVQLPALSWKIDDLWKQIDLSKMNQIKLDVDPFKRLIYIMIPDNHPYNLMVCDFSEGLTSQTVKWTHWDLPYVARSMSLTNIQDVDSYQYVVRLGTLSSNNLFKLFPTATFDYDGAVARAINSSYQTAYVPIDIGSLNIYRAIRTKAKGTGNLTPSTIIQDQAATQTWADWTLATVPGLDYFRQINVENEKVSVKLSTVGQFLISRIDLFGRPKFKQRPA